MFVSVCLYHSPVFYPLVENCLMQRAALAGSEAAALFLATHGAKVNHVNKWVCINIYVFYNQTWCGCPLERLKFQCQSHVFISNFHQF